MNRYLRIGPTIAWTLAIWAAWTGQPLGAVIGGLCVLTVTEMLLRGSSGV